MYEMDVLDEGGEGEHAVGGTEDSVAEDEGLFGLDVVAAPGCWIVVADVSGVVYPPDSAAAA